MNTGPNSNSNMQIAPLLLDVKKVAGMIGCSKSHVWRLLDGGRFPRPVKVGALTRWRTVDVQKWIDDGGTSLDSRNCAG